MNRGLIETPEYVAYQNAKARCAGKREKDFSDYAGRGIEFRFSSFEDFYREVGNKPSEKMMLDRINNNGHYEPGNIRWTTPSESAKNKRLTGARVSHLKRISSLGAQVAKDSGQASTIAHIRWHKNRGITKEGCLLWQ